MLRALVLTICTFLIVGFTYGVYSLAADGARASLMRFEGEPPEGMEYWRRKELYEALPGLVGFGLMMTALAVVVGLGWFRLCRDLSKDRKPPQ